MTQSSYSIKIEISCYKAIRSEMRALYDGRLQLVNRAKFDRFCASLPAAQNVVQWGNASVWKIGGKIFAICSHWGPGETEKISFKCSDLTYAILVEQEGFIPAPYLARAKWVQLVSNEAMTEDDIREYIEEAYSLIKAKLTRAVRTSLGI